jgi:signal transduction histidine kinase
VGAIWQVMTGESDAADVSALLGMLVDAVEARTAGSDHLDPRLAGATGRRLVHALRTALVRGWAEESLPALQVHEVVAVLRALEEVYGDLEPDWSRDLGPVPGPGFELFVDIAHDLRSPLNSILFLAETLQRGGSGAVTDLQKRQLGLIYSAALGLNNLASDALELALDRDRLVEKEPSPFSVTEVMEAVRAIIYPVAEEKGLEMRLLPPPARDHRLGQPVALGRVLLNLTTNALKFTDEGYVELSAGGRPRPPRAVGARHRPRGQPRRHPQPVPAVPPGPRPQRRVLLGHRPGPRHLPQAGARDGLGAAARDAAAVGNTILFRVDAADRLTNQPFATALSCSCCSSIS